MSLSTVMPTGISDLTKPQEKTLVQSLFGNSIEVPATRLFPILQRSGMSNFNHKMRKGSLKF